MKARQGHLFIVHFRLGQPTFTINNRHRKSLLTLASVLNQWLFDAKLQFEKYKNPISIFTVYFLSRPENPLSYRRSRTREDSQSSVADTL